MQGIEKAIKLAIEKGDWRFRGTEKVLRVTFDQHNDITITLDGGHYVCVTTIHEIFSDPLFWQALGKALGWRDKVWHYKAVTWFDGLMVGNDQQKFWEELCK